jgi:NADH dehydrogenase FAD-containing subunit
MALDPPCKVVLIDPRDNLIHAFALLRAVVRPNWEEATTIPLDKMLKKGVIIRGEVVRVEDKTVTLADGSSQRGDFLVLCHGGGNSPLPQGIPDDVSDGVSLKKKLKEKQSVIKNANSILIVGGGPIGTELAGEIISFYHDKKVTLVQRSSHLLSNSVPPMSKNLVEKLEKALVEMKVDLKLSSELVSLPNVWDNDGFVSGSMDYKLTDGSCVTADLLILCVNARKRKEFLPSIWLDDKGLVKVDDTLRVVGTTDIFCLGDANNLKTNSDILLSCKQPWLQRT